MKHYKIYQVNEDKKDACCILFCGVETVKEMGLWKLVNPDTYNMVYEGECEDEIELDDLYQKFNIGRPKDFKGHSLSTSDIIELDGKYYYCDSYGWEEITFNNKKETTMKQTEKKVAMTTDEKVFNLCVESAKQSKNGYTFNLKDVWQAARKKYKLAKQDVIDAMDAIAKEHEIKKVGEGPSNLFALVELMPKEEKKAEPTPIMKQFCELKAKHPDALILFRCGDFYETYEHDAEVCAKELGITLTKRSSDDTKMAGFPYHALDTYLPKLIRAGHRVAICDQLEDPKLTKKLEKRGITEMVESKKEEKEDAPVKEKKGAYPFTPCEIAQFNARKEAQKRYGAKFSNFAFARVDTTTNKEYKNSTEAKKAKANMDNLLYLVKVVEGVEFSGRTRIEAYENFLNSAV